MLTNDEPPKCLLQSSGFTETKAVPHKMEKRHQLCAYVPMHNDYLLIASLNSLCAAWSQLNE